MSPEKQRIAIAEACGWHGPFHKKTQALMTNWWSKDKGVWWLHPDGTSLVMASSVPDYLNDLNAMHEAEKVLLTAGSDYSRWERYDNYLFDLCGGFSRAHATAAQRAEAFLRTLGKWEGAS